MGGWVLSATSRPLCPQKRDPVPIVQETGWAPGPVWTGAENHNNIKFKEANFHPRESKHRVIKVYGEAEVYFPAF
jgi:hypothetical protein